MGHKHTYDEQGKQICCTQTEKIYTNAVTGSLVKQHSKNDGHNHDKHSDEDRHSHSGGFNINLKMFLTAIISLFLLLIAVALDNYFTQTWFIGWVRIGWYILSYIPVGFPVIKEAIIAISKGDIFSEFLLMSIATIGAFSIGEYPEGVAVMLFYAIGEVFQTLAVKRAKSNIKTLLDQRPDEVTILQNNILDGILGIVDPRTDARVDFVGGIRGLQVLADRVDSGQFAAAFSLYAVTIDQLFAIADSGNVMPPKSTWFEPKLRDGLLTHLIYE